MKTTMIEERALRRTVKAAGEEVFEERKEMMSDLLEEALLDIGLARAIREGESSREVSRQSVFSVMKAHSRKPVSARVLRKIFVESAKKHISTGIFHNVLFCDS